MPAFQMSRIPAAALLMQFPANTPKKGKEVGLNTWVFATHAGDLDRIIVLLV